MQTMTRGLIRYQDQAQTGYDGGDAWRSQQDLAAACLAAAALQGGMPRVGATFGDERDLALFLSRHAADRRRTAVLKFLAVMLTGMAGIAAGLYVGVMT